MEPSGIALILGALGTFIGALAIAFRGIMGDRFKRQTEESTNILSGYTDQIKILREELKECRSAHGEEVRTIRAAHAEEMERLIKQHRTEIAHQSHLHDEDRQEWAQEKAELRTEVEMLKAQLVALLSRIDNGPTPRRPGDRG